MSRIRELQNRAALALQALDGGNYPEARRLLLEDAKNLMPKATVDLSSPYAVTELQVEFQSMRRRSGNIPAAMCIVAPQKDKPGAFRFHFSGHEAVVRILQGKAGLKVAEVPSPAPTPDLDGDGLPSRKINAVPPEDVQPVDELAAKRAELEQQVRRISHD